MQKTIEVKTVLSEVIYNDCTKVCKLEYPESSGYSKFSGTGNYTIETIRDNTSKGLFYYVCSYLSFGDYDNSCHIERSNVREFLKIAKEENFTDYLHVSGMYGSESIYIDVMADNETIIDTLCSLESYPAINDEDCSNLEREMIDTAFTESYYRDFETAINKKLSIDYSDITSIPDFYRFISDTMEKENEYAIIESGGIVYFPIDKIIANITIDKLPPCYKYEIWE